MPEGDTLHKIANALRPDLEGRRLDRLWLRDAGDVTSLIDPHVVRVEAIGKHLFVRFADGCFLRTHLGMKGSWHRYQPGEPWQRARPSAGVTLETPDYVFVCFRPSQLELARPRTIGPTLERDHLGPDVMADDFDLDRVVARARTHARPDTTAADLLLDQRVASGIGNVYKCEALFLERIHPDARAEHLADDTVRALFDRARALMRENVASPARRTRRAGPRYWVYRRGRRPCLRCGTGIRRVVTGRGARSTYLCPRCQPPTSA